MNNLELEKGETEGVMNLATQCSPFDGHLIGSNESDVDLHTSHFWWQSEHEWNLEVEAFKFN